MELVNLFHQEILIICTLCIKNDTLANAKGLNSKSDRLLGLILCRLWL